MMQMRIKYAGGAGRCRSLLLGLMLAARCLAADSETPAAPPAATELPAKPAEAAVSPAAPDAGKATGLVGISYTRAYIAPRFLGKKWAVKQQVTLDDVTPHDALLVSNGAQKAVVISRQKRRLQGVTYEYTVTDELTIDALQNTQVIALCKGEDENDMIVVGQRERHAHPALWAIRVNSEGRLTLLDAQFVQRFVCKRRT